jgi:hypothetical protein
MQAPIISARKTRKNSSSDSTTSILPSPLPSPPPSLPYSPVSYGLNADLENFLNVNASEAYKRPWHRLERGLRLNRIRSFVEAERQRLTLTVEDTEYLRAKIEKALEKKLLNSKTCVVYDQEKQEIQEIKGLIYHKTADGRILSSIVDKKLGTTFRKKASTAVASAAAVATAAAVAGTASALP